MDQAGVGYGIRLEPPPVMALQVIGTGHKVQFQAHLRIKIKSRFYHDFKKKLIMILRFEFFLFEETQAKATPRHQSKPVTCPCTKV